MKLSRLITISLGTALLGASSATAQNGWTTLTPSGDSRLIYVSSSAGNDANSGLSPSAPKRTIGAGYNLVRNGYPDHLLLKKGDTFYETLTWTKSGRSENEMAVLGSYGSGARPRLLTGSQTAISMYGETLSHVAVVGIAMKAHTWAGQLPPGQDPPGLSAIAPGTNLLIEGCYIESYANSMVVQGWPTVRTNTRIRRNVMVDPLRLDPNNGSVCIFMAEYDGVLIEENVFDNSVANEANRGAMLSHAVYLGEGFASTSIIRGNIAHNGGRTNFNIRSGGIIENNLSIRGAQGITCGVSYAENYADATIRDNVITESRNNQNGQELGFGMSFDKMQSLDIEGNLIFNSTDGTNAMAITMSQSIRSANIRHNVVYRWQGPTQPVWGVETINITGIPEGHIDISNNVLQQPGNAHLVTFNSETPPVWLVSLSNNSYYSGRANGLWFIRQLGSDATFSQWTSLTGESGSQATQVSFNNAGCTVASYNASLGGAGSTAAFLAQARLQSKDYWRPQYTAAGVNDYLRNGFNMGTTTATCRPDMNDDGLLNVSDFTGFLQAYAARQPRADFNQDGTHNVSDFTAFLQGYASGCP